MCDSGVVSRSFLLSPSIFTLVVELLPSSSFSFLAALLFVSIFSLRISEMSFLFTSGVRLVKPPKVSLFKEFFNDGSLDLSEATFPLNANALWEGEKRPCVVSTLLTEFSLELSLLIKVGCACVAKDTPLPMEEVERVLFLSRLKASLLVGFFFFKDVVIDSGMLEMFTGRLPICKPYGLSEREATCCCCCCCCSLFPNNEPGFICCVVLLNKPVEVELPVALLVPKRLVEFVPATGSLLPNKLLDIGVLLLLLALLNSPLEAFAGAVVVLLLLEFPNNPPVELRGA